MAEVLAVPREPDGQPYYQNPALRRSTPSLSSLFIDDPNSAPISSRPKDPNALPRTDCHPPLSLPTPAYSLPPSIASSASALSDASSHASSSDTDESVTTGLTLDTDLGSHADEDAAYRSHVYRTTHTPSSSPAYCEDGSDDLADVTTRSDSPLLTPTVVDDTAIKTEPSRQVDFLSYEWREEDIWSSWRHIVSQRKTIYGERSRLENASWRTWAKTKFELRTVSPERLNWLKESDVTWLYGPLKQANSYPITSQISAPESQLSKNNSFIHKKPILKKRSMSEVMLQRSLSTSSLVKQAADRVQAQGRQHRRSITSSDIVDSKLESETPSRDQVDYFTSRSTSNGGSPGETHERRHIRFDERVEQCIAIDCKDPGPDPDEESEDEDEERVPASGSDSSSDDGLIMMKRKKRASTKKAKNAGSHGGSSGGRKIIETLPSTTLKYRTDSPDVTEEAQHHTFARSWNSSKLSPSPSQETLRPSNPSSNFLIPADDDDGMDSDSSWSFGANNPKSSLGASTGNSSEMEGMRRTGSGMFMPYGEGEDEVVATGIFGRVSETINTARDIAHVIWNVGWRS